MQVKKQPMRKCTGCNEMKEKRELVRIVREPEGAISVDLTGKKSGRGAYICRSLSCLKKARKSKRLETNLGCPISEEVYDNMEREISQYE